MIIAGKANMVECAATRFRDLKKRIHSESTYFRHKTGPATLYLPYFFGCAIYKRTLSIQIPLTVFKQSVQAASVTETTSTYTLHTVP